MLMREQTMKCTSRLVMIMLAGLFACSSVADLEENFRNTPPDSARAHTWWHWMDGHVTAEGITADLEAMKQAGLGGFQAFAVGRYFPSGPVQYMSDQWRQLMRHAVAEADRLGLEMCMHNCAGWSSSGGPWITPEYSMKKVVWSETRLEGSAEFDGQLQQPETVADFYRDIAVFAFPTPRGELEGEGFRLSDWRTKAGYETAGDKKNGLQPDDRAVDPGDVIALQDVIDLSERMDESGRLRWQPPAGRWTVLRMGYTSTGKQNAPAQDSGRGLECDKLDKQAAELHWQNSVQKVIDDAGPLAGRVFNNVLIDSYEMGCQNWTASMGEDFRERMGYDLTPYLPALTGRVVDSVEVSERFLWDFRKVIADLFTENYFGYFAEMAHRNGLMLSIEPYGNGNFNDFCVADQADIPMGEWWAQASEGWHHWSGKLSASAMHVNGHKYVGAEAFTAGGAMAGFVNHPFLLKSQGDYFFCQGVNRFIFHTHVHQPWLNVLPGMTMGPWGGQYNRNNTWFLKGRAWLDYVARCQYLLQEGRFVADLCYLTGEQSPQQAVTRQALNPAPPVGYDYDFCSYESFRRMTVQDGELALPSGMRYRLLVLPVGPMRPAMLSQVRDLVRTGATVYGSAPLCSPSLENYPACDQQVQALADELWGADRTAEGERQVGKGKVVWGRPLDEVLAAINLPPDFAFTGGVSGLPTEYPGNGIEYIHRRIDDAEVYFISNQNHCTNSIQAIFRVTGRRPQLWHPDTGKIEQMRMYSFTGDGLTMVPLTLDPAGSVFVVFRESGDDPARIESVSLEEAASAPPPPTLQIRSAVYGNLAADSQQQVDVTKQIQAMVNDGNRLQVKADNNLAGDPASGVVKSLKVEYTYDGVDNVISVREGQVLILPLTMVIDEPGYQITNQNGQPVLIAQRNGRYQVRKADGLTVSLTVNDLAAPTTLEGPWTLHLPKGWVAPVVEQITLDKLIDWSQHENDDVKHFSGTATYVKKFDLPAAPAADEKVLLDLGQVQIMAQVKLNGHNLGVLWKPPFRVEITDLLQVGDNTLEIEVTNLWVNRLIGDLQYPDGVQWKPASKGRGYQPVDFPDWLKEGQGLPDNGRRTFVTWRHHQPNSPLVPSGLIGPVRLIHEKVVAVR